MSSPLTPQQCDDIDAVINAAAQIGADIDCGTAHALLATVRHLTDELAHFAGRVNELESQLCDCEPVREHTDYKRPAFYQHEAHCRVHTPASV